MGRLKNHPGDEDKEPEGGQSRDSRTHWGKKACKIKEKWAYNTVIGRNRRESTSPATHTGIQRGKVR